MMSPCTPVPTMHRNAVQAAPFRAMFVTFSAVTGPLSGLPSCRQSPPPFLVTSVVPSVPSATHVELLTQATPLRAFGVPLAWADQVEPLSVLFSRTPLPPVAAPAA